MYIHTYTYIHTYMYKVPAVAKLFGTLTAAAQEMMPALPLEIVRKKINVSDAVAWEHEQVTIYPITIIIMIIMMMMMIMIMINDKC
jgi:hypothetical protein